MSFFVTYGLAYWTLYDAFLCIPDASIDPSLTKEELSRWKQSVALCRTKYNTLPQGAVVIERIPQETEQHEFFNKTLQSFVKFGPRNPDREQYMIYTKVPDASSSPEEAIQILYSCYRDAIRLAAEKGCSNVFLPYLGTRCPDLPKREAITGILSIATEESTRLDIDVTFHIGRSEYGKECMPTDISAEDIDAYLKEKYISPPTAFYQTSSVKLQRVPFPPSLKEMLPEIETALSNSNDPFSVALMKYAKCSGMTYAEIYGRANIDRRLFSKMKQPNYRPRKNTILALCIAMKLSLAETNDLLEHAGYALSHSSDADLIVEYFIRKEFYDIDKINQVLFSYGLTLLGA